MSLDVEQVTKAVLAAMKDSLGALGGRQAKAAKEQARALAMAMVRIGDARLAGEIDDDQAKAFLQAQSEAMQADLIAQAGLASQDAGDAVSAALKTLIKLALDAANLGWAAPIIEDVLKQIGSPPAEPA